ncbi:MAG: HDOD domain-containing protein [Vicinamibacteria bacterium]
MSDLADLYRRPAATPAAVASPPTQAPVSLAARLEREIREGRVELPILPQAAVDVQELIARDAGLPAIVRAIEREPIVAAALVKYANAAVYAGLRDVTDLQQAIARLGLDSVRETVVSLSARAAFKADNPAQAKYYSTIWTHSLTTAVAARRLAEFVSVPKETAFLAGLLHDIGRICVLRGITTLRTRDPKGFVLPDNTIGEFTDALHCAMGEALCQAWNIPVELSDAIKRHHDVNLTEPQDTLAAVVQVADLMAAKIGASLHPEPNMKLVERPSFAALQLDDVKIAMLLVELEDECESMSKLL